MFRFVGAMALIFLSCLEMISAQNPIVTLTQGQVEGTNEVSALGRQYYSYRAIPYGKPPVDDLRFQPPQPADPWDGVLDGTVDGPQCYQEGGGSEDCLFVYVNTPLPPGTEAALPVLVWIHGGGFAAGSPRGLGTQRFMDTEVIVAALAYRLGPFGFFSTGDSEANGNYGLLDQSLGLKWIQDNIASFGGDPTKVTIFGESAGGASVAYQVLSPASAGLFRGAISESGATLCPWGFQKDPLKMAQLFAGQLDCPTLNTEVLVDCVRGKSADDLVRATENLNGYSLLGYTFSPVVENPETGLFLTEAPVKILSDGTFNQVPVISGCNHDEGDSTYGMDPQDYQVIDDNFYNNILPNCLHNLTKYDRNLVNISYAVKAEYYDKIDITNSSQVARASIDINSDPFFKAAHDQTVRAYAAAGVPVYAYAFDYAGSGSGNHYTGEPEVSHSDELYYIFNLNSFTDQDQYISDHMISMWTNFAISLNPTPTGDIIWEPTPNQEDLLYLRFYTDSITMEQGYQTERMRFWEQTVPVIAAA